MKKKICRIVLLPPPSPAADTPRAARFALEICTARVYSRSEIYVYLPFVRARARARTCLLCNPLSRNFANLRELRLIFVRLMYYRDDGHDGREREREREGEFANANLSREELARRVRYVSHSAP